MNSIEFPMTSDKCRTCLTFKGQQTFRNITNQCCLGKSFKNAITMLIPDMENTLTNDDSICEICCETLLRVVIFVHNCVVIEADFNKRKLILTEDSIAEDNDNMQSTQGTNSINTVEEINQATCLPASTSVEYVDYQEDIPTFTIDDWDDEPKLSDGENVSINDRTTGSQNDSDDAVEEENGSNDSKLEPENNSDEVHTNNEYDYCTVSETSGSVNSVLPDIKGHNRVVSLYSVNQMAVENILKCLKEDVVVVDITKKPPERKNDRKRVLLIGFDLPPYCSKCYRPVKPNKVHDCKKKNGSSQEEEIDDDNEAKLVEECPKCGKDIDVYEMKQHFRMHQREEYRKNYRAKKARREWEKAKELKKNVGLKCRTCNEIFETDEEFKFHQQLHPPLICEQCGKGFSKTICLKAHMKTHDPANGFVCEVCGKAYKGLGGLQAHVKTHGDKQYKCSVCPKMFTNQGKANHHMKMTHQKSYNQLCPSCGKLFSSHFALQIHIRLIHKKEKPYQCQVCDKRFGRMDYLNNHMACHTGERKYNSTSGSGILNSRPRYRIEDKGERPVPCKFCGSIFMDLIRLRRHLRTHLRRFPCQFCPLTFASKARCQTHEKIHEGSADNFFRCNVCWKRLITKEALNEHMKSHDKPRYACNICGKLFNRKFLLNHHVLMDHSRVPDKDEADEIILDSLLEVTDGNGILRFN